MIDQALQNALLRQSEISTILVKASADLAEVSAFIHTYHKMHMLSEPPISREIIATDAFFAQKRAAANPLKNATKEEVEASLKAAREAIGRQNKPMAIGELYTAIAEYGHVIKTNAPLRTYGARLRDNRSRSGLVFLKRYGWWLVERPYAPAHYMPNNVIRAGKFAA